MNKPVIHTLPIHINPIGHVRSSLELPTACAKGEREETPKPRLNRHADQEAELVLQNRWSMLLDGIEDYSHVMVLYWPHLLSAGRTQQKKIHPMGRTELPITGVFATRTPGRPNPVLVTVAKLIKRADNVLHVKGLEAINGSPIIDIKPHTMGYWATEAVKVPQWMQDLQKEALG